jgi:transposase
LTRAAAAGEQDLYYLDQCGFAPTLPTSYTWARLGVRPLVPYEAPEGRRVNVIGALAPAGPRPHLLWRSRTKRDGPLDSVAFLDFVCRDVGGLPTSDVAALPPGYRRPRPCHIVLDNYSVHRSKAVHAVRPQLAAVGITLVFLPPYSPELNAIEPLWRHVKYERLRTRSYKSAEALQAAVDTALTEHASTLGHPTNYLPRAA